MFFHTTEQLREHIAVNAGFELEPLLPHLRMAATKYIIPAIGKELFTELLSVFELGSTGAGTQAQRDAIFYLQAPLANYAVLLYSPIGFVSIGNAGIMENSTREAGSARQWVTYDLKKSLLDTGDSALDDLLSFLEDHADDYPTWKNSAAYTVNNSLFISNITEMAASVGNVQQSRRFFLAMRPYLQKAEQFYIRPLLGKALFDHLKALVTPTAPEKELLHLLIGPIAHLSLAKALPELSLYIGDEGIKLRTSTNGILSENKPDMETIASHQRSLKQDAEALLDHLKSHLLENADDYALFKESNTYKNANSDDDIQNDSCAPFVLV